MKTFNLVARQSGTAIMWDGTPVDLWGFKEGLGGNVPLPSPLLVVNEGDSVTLNVINQSSMPHTIHMHGLDVNQANDGVEMTSFMIPPVMGTGTYKFKATHAGSFMYHCHVETVIHLQLGMYGGVVVKAAGGTNHAWTGGPAFDKDYTWVLSDVDKEWHDNIPLNGSIPGFTPDYFLVNGKARQQLNDTTISIAANVGDKVYLRLINIGYTLNKVVFPASLNAEILASDGRPLAVKEISDTVAVYPGERYEVMLDFASAVTDSILVEYYNMYNDSILFTNKVPLGATPPPPPPTVQYDQLDNFSDASTQSWGSGGPNPNPPVNVYSGGPTGSGDAYLEITSNGGSSSGAKLVAFNTAHWAGDYIAEGIKTIRMHVNNISGPDLNLRLRFDGPGGTFLSVNPVQVLAGSGWQSVIFPIEAADLTGGSDYTATLSEVSNLWIYNSAGAIFPGPVTSSVLGVDNILATGPATGFPVEWLAFTAKPSGNQVQLNWTTGIEQNNRGFEVEYSTQDIFNEFSTLGFVEGKGNSDTRTDYTFLTESLKPGTYQFRLRQVDFDGKSTYSKITTVVLNGEAMVSLYPNPVVGRYLYMNVNLPKEEKITFEILDIYGKRIESFEPGKTTINNLKLDLEEYLDGMYICRVITKTQNLAVKFMVLRG
ncbi:MAG: multicopper oxidase domain-containing protein [Bacteroidia bacterium]|nr:multicopper oxidase domain-containing protein [Bacteroidia bacterium]